MNSPFKGSFKVTQAQSVYHDGLDIVALGDKTVYSTIAGTVMKVGWENPLNHKQGFGYYVVVKQENSDNYYFFGHLKKNSASVKTGAYISKGGKLGIMGTTGKSTGEHLHYCCRKYRSKDCVLDISKLSGIPNRVGVYRPSTSGTTFLRKGTWNVRTSPFFKHDNIARVVQGVQTVIYVDTVESDGVKWYQLRDGNYISVNACIDLTK